VETLNTAQSINQLHRHTGNVSLSKTPQSHHSLQSTSQAKALD